MREAADSIVNSLPKQAPGKMSTSNPEENSHHFWSEAETAAYVDWINSQLGSDPELAHILPISEKGTALFEACNDGILLSKLVNRSVSGTINLGSINKKPKSPIHKSENLIKVINGCKNIGVKVHNIGPQDILQATPHLCLGIVWQIIKVGLLANVASPVGGSLDTVGSTEGLNTRSAANPSSQSERALLRWLNQSIVAAGYSGEPIKTFGVDLSDSLALAYLVSYLAPAGTTASQLDVQSQIHEESDLSVRAERVLNAAGEYNCRAFTSPSDIVSGNRNLNMAFVAVLYNTRAAAVEAEVKARSLESELSNAANETERARGEKQHAQDELAQARAEIIRMEAQSRQQETDAESYRQATVRALEGKIESLSKQLAVAVKDRNEAEKRNAIFEFEIDSLQADLSDKNAVIDDLEESSGKKIADLEQSNKQLQFLLENAEKLVNTGSDANAALGKRNSDLELRINRLNEENAYVKLAFNTSEEELRKAKDQRDSAIASNEELQPSVNALREELVTLKQEMNDQRLSRKSIIQTVSVDYNQPGSEAPGSCPEGFMGPIHGKWVEAPQRRGSHVCLSSSLISSPTDMQEKTVSPEGLTAGTSAKVNELTVALESSEAEVVKLTKQLEERPTRADFEKMFARAREIQREEERIFREKLLEASADYSHKEDEANEYRSQSIEFEAKLALVQQQLDELRRGVEIQISFATEEEIAAQSEDIDYNRQLLNKLQESISKLKAQPAELSKVTSQIRENLEVEKAANKELQSENENQACIISEMTRREAEQLEKLKLQKAKSEQNDDYVPRRAVPEAPFQDAHNVSIHIEEQTIDRGALEDAETIANLQEQVNYSAIQVESLQSEVAMLQSTLGDIYREKESLQDSLRKAEERVVALKEESRFNRVDSDNIIMARDTTITSLREKLMIAEIDLAGQVSKSESEIAAEREFQDALLNQLQETDIRIRELDSTVNYLRSKTGELSAERQKLLKTVSELEEQLIRQRGENERNAYHHEGVLMEKESIIKILTERTVTLQRQNNQRIAGLSDQEQQELLFRFNETEERLVAALSEIQSLQDRLETALRQRNAYQVNMETINITVVNQKRESEVNLWKITHELDEKEKTLDTYKARVVRMESGILERQRSSNGQLIAESSANIQYREEIAAFKVQIDEQATEIVELKETIANQQTENKRLSMRVASVEMASEIYKNEINLELKRSQETIVEKDTTIAAMQKKIAQDERMNIARRVAVEAAAMESYDKSLIREKLMEAVATAEEAESQVQELSSAVKESEKASERLQEKMMELEDESCALKRDNYNIIKSSLDNLQIKEGELGNLSKELQEAERHKRGRVLAMEEAATQSIERIKLKSELQASVRKFENATRLANFLNEEISKYKSNEEMNELKETYSQLCKEQKKAQEEALSADARNGRRSTGDLSISSKTLFSRSARTVAGKSSKSVVAAANQSSKTINATQKTRPTETFSTRSLLISRPVDYDRI